MTAEELIQAASKVVGAFSLSEHCEAGGAAAALVTASGNVYTGICIDAACSLGFCAEHAAIAEMLKARESDIRLIVAVDAEGGILAPCGRCRELMWQVNPQHATTKVILGRDRTVLLTDLLPHPWSE
jgi:cytidine deaminase